LITQCPRAMTVVTYRKTEMDHSGEKKRARSKKKVDGRRRERQPQLAPVHPTRVKPTSESGKRGGITDTTGSIKRKRGEIELFGRPRRIRKR